MKRERNIPLRFLQKVYEKRFSFEFMMKTENLFFFFNIHIGLHEELQGEGFTSTALNMIKIYVLTSAELNCMMSHRSNRTRTRTVLQEEQRKSSKQDLKVPDLLQKVFPMLTKGDAGEEETLSLPSLYFTVKKKEIKKYLI
ncbi:hypothetical protein AMECASPLE_038985 [Ameca splendens]|uniref:Uncharacterized protein n=1 Tax=Ameca splendens TaxID=208324 RepID=A0ABV0YJG5_9TELE